MPRPPNVALFRALWSLIDGIWGIFKGSWGVLACMIKEGIYYVYIYMYIHMFGF